MLAVGMGVALVEGEGGAGDVVGGAVAEPLTGEGVAVVSREREGAADTVLKGGVGEAKGERELEGMRDTEDLGEVEGAPAVPLARKGVAVLACLREAVEETRALGVFCKLAVLAPEEEGEREGGEGEAVGSVERVG
jgi:hypothetical protein